MTRDEYGKDGALALLLALLAFVPVLSKIGTQLGDLFARPVDALGIGLTLAQALPLVARRRWPAVCLLIVGGAFAAHQSLGFPTTFASLGLYLALYAAGAYQVSFRPALVVVGSAGYALLAVGLHGLGSPQGVPDYLAFYLSLAVAWLAGGAVRRWRMHEVERRRLAAEVATAAERARIARELHDVVTHHVTAMVVQADAAQFVLTSAPERAGEGLAAVSDTGRRALTELRYLLDVLEATGASASADRAPTLGKVKDLIEQARMSGQPVEWDEQGLRRPQSVEVELAAYRVVQEALTNAMKHAAGRPTVVQIRYGEQIEIDVTTNGPALAAPSTTGRGLAGLRERVRMIDGELVTGPRPDGGFGVRAVIPCKPVQE
ncbi:two-component sensor histidine kinase [Acrocarpospora pleiomorpha]|uniref:histidine kinase n=1 Tax=Acrocarpospora pleiomorpha TaxID=90975 RepID=A0A5M3XKA7_9ACTN|nr:histidine kinase [Acrocarpospora pleiomorpha]GES19573.1 two-component sensor histidine kinase [Acrocarpospora pleiomorpha]